jgi:hypothetical protein
MATSQEVLPGRERHLCPDAAPLTPFAKLLMMGEAVISLLNLILLVARSVIIR